MRESSLSNSRPALVCVLGSKRPGALGESGALCADIIGLSQALGPHGDANPDGPVLRLTAPDSPPSRKEIRLIVLRTGLELESLRLCAQDRSGKQVRRDQGVALRPVAGRGGRLVGRPPEVFQSRVLPGLDQGVPQQCTRIREPGRTAAFNQATDRVAVPRHPQPRDVSQHLAPRALAWGPQVAYDPRPTNALSVATCDKTVTNSVQAFLATRTRWLVLPAGEARSEVFAGTFPAAAEFVAPW